MYVHVQYRFLSYACVITFWETSENVPCHCTDILFFVFRKANDHGLQPDTKVGRETEVTGDSRSLRESE